MEDLPVEKLIAQLVVEALHIRLLPWGARSNVMGGDPLLAQMILQGVGNELRPIITT